MASTLFTIQACAAAAASSSYRKSNQTSLRTQSSNWWTPLFGWTSDPDYIDGNKNSTTTTRDSSKSISVDSGSDIVSSRSRFTPGGFTEKKAKQLRMKTMESETFHDIMYHSAIASRLASDLPIRSGR